MSIDSHQDLYAAVRELGDMFAQAGDTELATELRQVLRVSSMPTELLGEIRRTLARAAVRAGASGRMAEIVHAAMRYVESVLP